MKQDGRKLDHRTLEVIRKMAVKRVREGEKTSQVIASHGFSRTAIHGWPKAAKGRGRLPLRVTKAAPATALSSVF